jgi:hypothetical protein
LLLLLRHTHFERRAYHRIVLIKHSSWKWLSDCTAFTKSMKWVVVWRAISERAAAAAAMMRQPYLRIGAHYLTNSHHRLIDCTPHFNF